jgi:hypothetical protein
MEVCRLTLSRRRRSSELGRFTRHGRAGIRERRLHHFSNRDRIDCLPRFTLTRRFKSGRRRRQRIVDTYFEHDGDAQHDRRRQRDRRTPTRPGSPRRRFFDERFARLREHARVQLRRHLVRLEIAILLRHRRLA